MESEVRVGKYGFIRLIDSMGDDSSVVRAARVSYKDAPKKRGDTDLIRYLMRSEHTGPFEHVQFTFMIKVPMAIWRHWVRHRTGSFSEVSTRYTEVQPEFYTPKEWRLQSQKNKQSSEGFLSKNLSTFLSINQLAIHQLIYQFYRLKLKLGVSKEMARDDLPLATYTTAYWSVNLHNLFHFIKLRTGEGAQQEIREYAEALEELIKDVVPDCYRAFCSYVKGAVTFSMLEQMFLLEALKDDTYSDMHHVMTKGEVREFMAKINQVKSFGAS